MPPRIPEFFSSDTWCCRDAFSCPEHVLQVPVFWAGRSVRMIKQLRMKKVCVSYYFINKVCIIKLCSSSERLHLIFKVKYEKAHRIKLRNVRTLPGTSIMLQCFGFLPSTWWLIFYVSINCNSICIQKIPFNINFVPMRFWPLFSNIIVMVLQLLKCRTNLQWALKIINISTRFINKNLTALAYLFF